MITEDSNIESLGFQKTRIGHSKKEQDSIKRKHVFTKDYVVNIETTMQTQVIVECQNKTNILYV